MTPGINCTEVPTTPQTNSSPVSTTLAINLFHGFSVMGGVNTGNKFIVGFNAASEQ
jgi:hypothetical protein